MIFLLLVQKIYSSYDNLYKYNFYLNDTLNKPDSTLNRSIFDFNLQKSLTCFIDSKLQEELECTDTKTFIIKMVKTQKQHITSFCTFLSKCRKYDTTKEKINSNLTENKFNSFYAEYERLYSKTNYKLSVVYRIILFVNIFIDSLYDACASNKSELLMMCNFYDIIGELYYISKTNILQKNFNIRNITTLHNDINTSIKLAKKFKNPYSNDIVVIDVQFLLLETINLQFSNSLCSYKSFNDEIENIVIKILGIVKYLRKDVKKILFCSFSYETSCTFLFTFYKYNKTDLCIKTILDIILYIQTFFTKHIIELEKYDNINHYLKSNKYELIKSDLQKQINDSLKQDKGRLKMIVSPEVCILEKDCKNKEIKYFKDKIKKTNPKTKKSSKTNSNKKDIGCFEDKNYISEPKICSDNNSDLNNINNQKLKEDGNKCKPNLDEENIS